MYAVLFVHPHMDLAGTNLSAQALSPGSVALELGMPRTGWSPMVVPYGADQTVYLVIDRFGGQGGGSLWAF
jgi:hypothetical protein